MRSAARPEKTRDDEIDSEVLRFFGLDSLTSRATDNDSSTGNQPAARANEPELKQHKPPFLRDNPLYQETRMASDGSYICPWSGPFGCSHPATSSFEESRFVHVSHGVVCLLTRMSSSSYIDDHLHPKEAVMETSTPRVEITMPRAYRTNGFQFEATRTHHFYHWPCGDDKIYRCHWYGCTYAEKGKSLFTYILSFRFRHNAARADTREIAANT